MTNRGAEYASGGTRQRGLKARLLYAELMAMLIAAGACSIDDRDVHGPEASVAGSDANTTASGGAGGTHGDGPTESVGGAGGSYTEGVGGSSAGAGANDSGSDTGGTGVETGSDGSSDDSGPSATVGTSSMGGAATSGSSAGGSSAGGSSAGGSSAGVGGSDTSSNGGTAGNLTSTGGTSSSDTGPTTGGGNDGQGGTSTVAGTEVCGNIAGETWTKKGSPYRITCDIHVLSLTIEPGVIVEATGSYVFEVAGTLNATGTSDAPITFTTTADNSTGWLGIYFNASPAGAIGFVVVEKSVNGGIAVVDTSLTLDSCVLQNNEALQGGGLYVSGATSHVVVRNTKILGNVATDFFEAGGGLFLRDGASVEVWNSIFADNATVYANARGGGVFLCGGTLSMVNAVVVQNGAASYGNGSSGIAINTGGLSDCTGGNATVDSSIIFNNIPSQFEGSGISVTYSNVQGGQPGTGNIAQNPQFSDANYHLAETSPCVDSGNPSSAFDETCTPPALATSRNDMGAYGGPGACQW